MPADPDRPPSPTEKRRLERLKDAKDEFQRQVDSGSLSVRKMSDEDREKYPQRPEEQRRPRSGRSRS